MGGRGRKCLPPHLRNELHKDWLWPASYIPRAWNAFCGKGPFIIPFAGSPWWEPNRSRKPIPPPGNYTVYLWDKDGSLRPYYARTWRLKNFWNGRYLHFRIGFRWDDGEKPSERYYNLVIPFNLSWEYGD